MDSEFHPHKFHPRLYALDPYDLLLPIKDPKRRILGKCKRCEIPLERYCMPNKQGYLCYDCKRKRRAEREVKYVRKNGNKLRNHA